MTTWFRREIFHLSVFTRKGYFVQEIKVLQKIFYFCPFSGRHNRKHFNEPGNLHSKTCSLLTTFAPRIRVVFHWPDNPTQLPGYSILSPISFLKIERLAPDSHCLITRLFCWYPNMSSPDSPPACPPGKENTACERFDFCLCHLLCDLEWVFKPLWVSAFPICEVRGLD